MKTRRPPLPSVQVTRPSVSRRKVASKASCQSRPQTEGAALRLLWKGLTVGDGELREESSPAPSSPLEPF